MFDISKINYSAKTNTNRYSVCWPNMPLLPNMLLVAKIVYFEIVQRSPLLCAPGLVMFAPAVARLFCLALPWSYLYMFAQNKGDICISRYDSNNQLQSVVNHARGQMQLPYWLKWIQNDGCYWRVSIYDHCNIFQNFGPLPLDTVSPRL